MTAPDPLPWLDQAERIADDLRGCRTPADLPTSDVHAALAIFPELTAAVRAVLALADEWDTAGDARYATNRIAKETAARVLRAVVATAIGGEQ